MKVMLLCAGRGRRLRPWSDYWPKPMMPCAGMPLLSWHINKLYKAGYRELVINTGWLGDLIEHFYGDGSSLGVKILYSRESREEGKQLGFWGGIAHALPLLGTDPFLALNADIWTDWDYALARESIFPHSGAHLLLTLNPVWRLSGDFNIKDGCLDVYSSSRPYTFTGIAVYSASIFKGEKRLDFREMISDLNRKQLLSVAKAECFWIDAGIPSCMEMLQKRLAHQCFLIDS